MLCPVCFWPGYSRKTGCAKCRYEEPKLTCPKCKKPGFGINSKYGDTCEFCNEQLQVAGGAGRSSNAPQFSSAPTPSTLAPSGEMLNKSGGGSKEPQFPSAPE